MKKAFKQSLIYAAIAMLFYFAMGVLPEAVAYYGMLLFHIIHVLGVALFGLLFLYAGLANTGVVKTLLPFALIAINAGVIFLLALIRGK